MRTGAAALNINLKWRRLAPRLLSGLLLGLSLSCIGLNRANPELVEGLQSGVTDFFAPAIVFFGQPIVALRDMTSGLANFQDVYGQNRILSDENRNLIAWRDTALRLSAENTALRNQLRVAPDPEKTELMARVIGDPAGGFMHSVLLAAGNQDGVEKGEPAVTAASEAGANLGALVGRVVQAGERSARLLLLTDVNSRIPVMLEKTGVHGIVAGDNSEQPQLTFLPPGTDVTVGERVVTSGNDRLLPPGIAVGVISSVDDGELRITPLADLSRLDFVHVMKYEGVRALPAPEQPLPAAKTRHHI